MGFKEVVLADIKTKNYKQTRITDLSQYKTTLDTLEYPCEYVGGTNQQVKPFADIDKKIPIDSDFDMEVDILDYKLTFQNLFNRETIDDIYVYGRQYEKDGQIKISYHIIVDKIRISSSNLKKLLEQNNIFDDKAVDKGVYDENRGMYCLYTTKKYNRDTQTADIKPQFKPLEGKCKDISKYCITYIEEHFEDWDLKFPKIE